MAKPTRREIIQSVTDHPEQRTSTRARATAPRFGTYTSESDGQPQGMTELGKLLADALAAKQDGTG
jgi:hypothetical protein